MNTALETNVVLSYGDLSYTSGYQTRVLGELEFLDSQSRSENVLLAFDRQPDNFALPASIQVPYRVHPRSAMLRFYPEIARVARHAAIRIVHAHNLYSAALALSARPLHKYKVLLDYHGRIPEEYVYLGKGGEPSRKALEGLERWAVKNSDHIVVVSEKLREYLAERYRLDTARVSIIPCCADSTIFHWDTRSRETQRHALGLTGRFVCIHLGSFFEWYEPELLLQLFSQIRSSIPKAHLLVVTPAMNKTRDYLALRLPAEAFTVMSAGHNEVPGFLNASDLGFLLLRSSPNIKTSSPAKFSEYLNCGLPVVITPGVGDFSNLILQTGTGMVVNSGTIIDTGFLSSLQSGRNDFAQRCVDAGRNLTWQSQAVTWRNVLSQLSGIF